MTQNNKINRSMSALEWGMLFTLSILWGGSFFFVGVAVKELPVFTIVVARVSLAALILYLTMRVMGLDMPGGRKVWAAFFTMGFLNNVVPFTLIVWGQAHLASGVASILNAATPVFTVIFAHWWTVDEKMTRGRIFGVIAGLSGVAVMIGWQAMGSLGLDVLAQLAVLGAAISYAIAGLYGRRFRSLGISPMATATGQVTASGIMLFPVMLILDKPWTMAVPSVNVIGAIVGVALFSTALAYILYFRILASAGATNLLLVTFLIPVTAILLGVLFLDEALLPRHYTGMAMIGLGLAAIDGRLWQTLKGAIA